MNKTMVKEKVLKKLDNILEKVEGNNKRYIVGVSGIPGSGKTTFVNQIVNDFNKRCQKEVCIAISMDGFHLPKSVLDSYPNAKEMHARRGSYWTFDANKLVEFLTQLKKDTTTTTIMKAPSFSHEIGDPIENDIIIQPSHQIIIMDGLYLHLTQPEPWNRIPLLLLDEKWYLPIDIDEARRRTSQRHLDSGLVKTIEEGINRFNQNDILNAQYVLDNRDTSAEDIDIN